MPWHPRARRRRLAALRHALRGVSAPRVVALLLVLMSADPFSLCSHPGYFGKVGMRYFHKQKHHFNPPTINVEKLWTLVSAEVRAAATASVALRRA